MRLWTIAAGVTVAFSAAACRDIGGPDPDNPAGGVYALAAIDGQPVPAVSRDTTFHAGTLSIGVDGTVSDALTWSIDGEPEVTATESGTWVRQGGTLLFTGETTEDRLTPQAEGRLYRVRAGVTFRYQRAN